MTDVIKNDPNGYTTYTSFTARDGTGAIDNPTLTFDDFTISKDGGAPSPLTNLPTCPHGDPMIEIVLTQAETDADIIYIIAKDDSADEWYGVDIELRTVASSTTDTISAQIDALNDLSAAEVNAEMVDVLSTDIYTEITTIPSASTTLSNMLSFLFTLNRNKVEHNRGDTIEKLFADDETTEIGRTTLTDDGTTATKDEWEGAPTASFDNTQFSTAFDIS